MAKLEFVRLELVINEQLLKWILSGKQAIIPNEDDYYSFSLSKDLDIEQIEKIVQEIKVEIEAKNKLN